MQKPKINVLAGNLLRILTIFLLIIQMIKNEKKFGVDIAMTTKHWRMAEKDKVTKRRLGECTVIQPNHPRITKLTIKTLTRREAPVSWSLENHAAKNPHASVICRIYYITLP